MANYYFNVLDARNAELDGANKLNASSTGVYRGMLAGWPSGGSLGTSTGSAPYGQFYDYLRVEELPTSEDLGTYLSGKEINIVTGKFMCLVGPDLFVAGSVPAVGTKLYPGTAGKLDTAQNWSGATCIGKCVAQHTVADAGGSGSFTAARCIMEFPVYS
jgi:hypothetical protein